MSTAALARDGPPSSVASGLVGGRQSELHNYAVEHD
jgi:hypothetical protein